MFFYRNIKFKILKMYIGIISRLDEKTFSKKESRVAMEVFS